MLGEGVILGRENIYAKGPEKQQGNAFQDFKQFDMTKAQFTGGLVRGHQHGKMKKQMRAKPDCKELNLSDI